MLAIAVFSSLTAFVRWRAARFVLLGALFLAIVLFVDWRLRPGPYPALGYPMYQRAQVYCVLVVIVSLVLIGHVLSSKIKRSTYFQAGALVPPLIAVLAIDTVDTVRWTGFIGRFCREMTVSSSVSHAAFFAEGPTRRYGIDWTFPTMSVVLGGQASRTILAKPGFAGWQPFDPRHPPDVRSFKVGETICP